MRSGWWGALTLVAVLGAGPIAGAPALAAAAEAYEVRFAGYSSDAEIREYGSDASRIPIAASTTVLDLRFAYGLRDFTFCILTDERGARVASADLLGNEEDPTYLLPVPSEALSVGDPYDLACRTGYYGENGTTWRLVTVDDPTTTRTVLEPYPERLAVVERIESYFDAFSSGEPIRPGSRVRVIAPTGTWTPPGRLAPLEVTLNAAGTAVPLSGSVSVDGSTVEFDLPARIDTATGYNPFVSLQRSGTTAATGSSPALIETRTLGFSLAPTPATATTTALSLSASRVALTKPLATVTIRSDDGTAPVGSVTLLGDGYPIARTDLAASDGGRVVIRLPRLTRGAHVITAMFAADNVAQSDSTSPGRPLRVLL